MPRKTLMRHQVCVEPDQSIMGATDTRRSNSFITNKFFATVGVVFDWTDNQASSASGIELVEFSAIGKYLPHRRCLEVRKSNRMQLVQKWHDEPAYQPPSLAFNSSVVSSKEHSAWRAHQEIRSSSSGSESILELGRRILT